MMLSLIGTLGSAVISGVSNYFKTKQDIKKVKVQAEKEVIVAEKNAKIARLERESKQDFNINMEMIRNQKNSWKDEFVLLYVCMPPTMLFIPELQGYAINGLKALSEHLPFWYQILILGIFFTIYGLRDIFKIVLQILVNKIKGIK